MPCAASPAQPSRSHHLPLFTSPGLNLVFLHLVDLNLRAGRCPGHSGPMGGLRGHWGTAPSPGIPPHHPKCRDHILGARQRGTKQMLGWPRASPGHRLVMKRGPGEGRGDQTGGDSPSLPHACPSSPCPPRHTHQGRAVVAVEDVDEVSDGEHPCGDTWGWQRCPHPRCQAGEGARWCCRHSPTKLCVLLSQSGAARTPLATSATKAFLICW